MEKTLLNEENIYLFHIGKYFHSYEILGAHQITKNGMPGIQFSVWAPHAEQISVVGDFNQWDENVNQMERVSQGGIWSSFISYAKELDLYKYKILTKDNRWLYRSDPYAFYSEVRPRDASIVYQLDRYNWNDKVWMENRGNYEIYRQPINIYEVHLGSWKRHEDKTLFTYKEIAQELVPYVKKMGYTHIELLPIMEHPFDGSWGYQCSGYYSATSRYGRPEDLMYLIDQCHMNDIGVILDWVPGHFCPDEGGLSEFDGSMLYEKEQHREWGTYKFDFSRSEVQSFLISNAVFWFDKYHIDGLRVDGVTSILHLNYGKEEGEWIPNKFGGNGDLEAIDFIKQLNSTIFKYFPNVIVAAEESSAWPMVTWPVHKDGLGFNYKWNMGWMNDILKYMETDPVYRQYHHNLITFSLFYAFSENFMLPISHDEVVHGKKSLLDKMPGDYWQKFANVRAFFCYLMTHPGKKLLFMGTEFGQFIEWKYYTGLDWNLLDFEMHKKLHHFIKEINHFYLEQEPLWIYDHSWDGFQWIDADNYSQSIVSFLRKGRENDQCLIIISFTPVHFEQFRIGVPEEGIYQILFNSDEKQYGGTGNISQYEYKSELVPWHGKPFSIEFILPSYTGLIIKRKESEDDSDHS